MNKQAIQQILSESYRNLLESVTDEQTLAITEAITDDLIVAYASGRTDLVDELLGQIRIVGEMKRIQASNEAWNAVREVTRAVFRTAVSLAVVP